MMNPARAYSSAPILLPILPWNSMERQNGVKGPLAEESIPFFATHLFASPNG